MMRCRKSKRTGWIINRHEISPWDGILPWFIHFVDAKTWSSLQSWHFRLRAHLSFTSVSSSEFTLDLHTGTPVVRPLLTWSTSHSSPPWSVSCSVSRVSRFKSEQSVPEPTIGRWLRNCKAAPPRADNEQPVPASSLLCCCCCCCTRWLRGFPAEGTCEATGAIGESDARLGARLERGDNGWRLPPAEDTDGALPDGHTEGGSWLSGIVGGGLTPADSDNPPLQ